MSKTNKDFIIDDDGMIMEYVGNGGDVTIPDGVTDIFFQAFFGASIITSVVVPVCLKDLTPFTFERCNSLKEAKLCEGIEIIGVCAFNDCKSLEIVYLPKTLKKIEMSAFSECPSLKKIYYNGSKSDWHLIKKEDNWDENTGGYTIMFN